MRSIADGDGGGRSYRDGRHADTSIFLGLQTRQNGPGRPVDQWKLRGRSRLEGRRRTPQTRTTTSPREADRPIMMSRADSRGAGLSFRKRNNGLHASLPQFQDPARSEPIAPGGQHPCLARRTEASSHTEPQNPVPLPSPTPDPSRAPPGPSRAPDLSASPRHIANGTMVFVGAGHPRQARKGWQRGKSPPRRPHIEAQRAESSASGSRRSGTLDRRLRITAAVRALSAPRRSAGEMDGRRPCRVPPHARSARHLNAKPWRTANNEVTGGRSGAHGAIMQALEGRSRRRDIGRGQPGRGREPRGRVPSRPGDLSAARDEHGIARVGLRHVAFQKAIGQGFQIGGLASARILRAPAPVREALPSISRECAPAPARQLASRRKVAGSSGARFGDWPWRHRPKTGSEPGARPASASCWAAIEGCDHTQEDFEIVAGRPAPQPLGAAREDGGEIGQANRHRLGDRAQACSRAEAGRRSSGPMLRLPTSWRNHLRWCSTAQPPVTNRESWP